MQGPEPWFQRPWGVLLALVLLAPVGIALLWTGRHFERPARIGLTVASAIWFAFAAVRGAALRRTEGAAPQAARVEKEAARAERDAARAGKDAAGQAARVEKAAAPPSVDAAPPDPCEPRRHRGRSEPQYVGLAGFVGGDVDPDADRLPEGPWHAPILKQVGPTRWAPSGATLEHKTPVVVLEQDLHHTSHGFYRGALLVRTEDGRTAHIAPDDFVESAYWTCDAARAHRFYEPFVARLVGLARAVDRDGLWVDVPADTRVLCGVTSASNDLYAKDGQIPCLTWRQWKLRFGGGGLLYDAAQLEIVY